MKKIYVKTMALVLALTFVTNLSATAATVRVYNSVRPAHHYVQPVRHVNYVYQPQPVTYSNYYSMSHYEPTPVYVQTQPAVYVPTPGYVPISYVPTPVYQAPVAQRTVVNEYHVVENRGSILGPLLGAAALSIGIVALCK